MYSQDLSNYKTNSDAIYEIDLFLYSQDLSNYKTEDDGKGNANTFLYSQDLSNYKTYLSPVSSKSCFCILKI